MLPMPRLSIVIVTFNSAKDIDACLASGVGTMILTSSDKAANPTSVMGASKLLAEKLVSAATNYRGSHPTTFASVRFGNVLGSRGSAIGHGTRPRLPPHC